PAARGCRVEGRARRRDGRTGPLLRVSLWSRADTRRACGRRGHLRHLVWRDDRPRRACRATRTAASRRPLRPRSAAAPPRRARLVRHVSRRSPHRLPHTPRLSEGLRQRRSWMKIGYNGLRLARQRFGIGRYIEYTLKNMDPLLRPDEQVVIYVRDEFDKDSLGLSEQFEVRQIHSRLDGVWWE